MLVKSSLHLRDTIRGNSVVFVDGDRRSGATIVCAYASFTLGSGEVGVVSLVLGLVRVITRLIHVVLVGVLLKTTVAAIIAISNPGAVDELLLGE